MIFYILNAFVLTTILDKDDKGNIAKRIIIEIRGSLVDIFIETCSGVYDKYVVYEKTSKMCYM